MQLLFLSGWFPYPTNNGSKLRIYNLLRGLAQHHDLTLLAFADQPGIDIHSPELRALCRDIQVVPAKPFDPHRWRARLGFLSLKPRSVLDTYSPEMAQRIEQLISGNNFELVIASQLGLAGYAASFKGVPAIFEEVELGLFYEQFHRASSLRTRFRHGLTWAKHRRYVAGLLNHFGACTVVSEQERQLLAAIHPGFRTIEIIPNCINLADYAEVRQTPQSNHLIFTGSFGFAPNYEAMTWFLGQVYPRVQAEIPNVRLTITGDHRNLPLPPAANVTLSGFVDDIRPLLASAWLSLAPIRVGGGTRLKILEAMALGTPVVATSKGAEGLAVEPDVHLLLADTPQAYAEAVLRLLRQPELRERLAANAYKLVQEKYNWPTVMPRFLKLADRVARGHSPTA
jgi:glycosyltransferase involved in cell wall biosynthesis